MAVGPDDIGHHRCRGCRDSGQDRIYVAGKACIIDEAGRSAHGKRATVKIDVDRAWDKPVVLPAAPAPVVKSAVNGLSVPEKLNPSATRDFGLVE